MGKNYNLYDKVVAAALTEVFNYTKDSQYMYFPTEWKYKYSDGPFFLEITKIAQSMNHKPACPVAEETAILQMILSMQFFWSGCRKQVQPAVLTRQQLI